jgi:predicted nucleotidyltransferase
MPSIVDKLIKKELIEGVPAWVKGRGNYEVIMGSNAYGVSGDISDVDLYGFLIPPKEYLYPPKECLLGFSKKLYNFDQIQKHHIKDKDSGNEYDVTMYNIVKFFKLCENNNPNMLDSLFVPNRCVLFMDDVGKLVRENRHAFLSRKCFHTFKGYAYNQLKKIKNYVPEDDSNRSKLVIKYGYDVKKAYHIVRLVDQAEQLITEGDMDLESNSEKLKAIRRGAWSFAQIEDYFHERETGLLKLMDDSKLPYSANHQFLNDLLVKCISMKISDINSINSVERGKVDPAKIRQIQDMLDNLLE